MGVLVLLWRFATRHLFTPDLARDSDALDVDLSDTVLLDFRCSDAALGRTDSGTWTGVWRHDEDSKTSHPTSRTVVFEVVA